MTSILVSSAPHSCMWVCVGYCSMEQGCSYAVLHLGCVRHTFVCMSTMGIKTDSGYKHDHGLQ